MKALYDFWFKKNDGMTQFMQDYRGKVILIVNIATACGFTPQLGELELLYKKYCQQGLVILGFPCNQFGGQNPENGEETAGFCKINYGVSFPIFNKIEVNGTNAAPLYTYLKSAAGFDANTAFPNGIVRILEENTPDYKTSSDIKWNFTKFLVDREGCVCQRFEAPAGTNEIKPAVVNLLVAPVSVTKSRN